MVAEGAAIVDIGGESTRPGVGGRLRRRGAASRRAGAGAARGRGARSRSTRRRRRSRAALSRSAPSSSTTSRRCAAIAEHGGGRRRVGRLPLPHAHARRAANDAGRSALRRRRGRTSGRSSRSGSRSPSRRGFPKSASASIPGIGFGKTVEHNVELLRRLDELAAIGRPGARRRLAQALSRPAAQAIPRRRSGSVSASVAAAVAAVASGATIVRVHDVRETVEALLIVNIELHGLEVFGYHGATEVEEREGQTVPVRRRARPSGASRTRTTSSRRSTTARSQRACARSRTGGACSCWRRLPASIADELMTRFPVERVRVRVRKPHVQLDPPAEYSAVTVERP